MVLIENHKCVGVCHLHTSLDFVGAFSVATYTQSASHRISVETFRVSHIFFKKKKRAIAFAKLTLFHQTRVNDKPETVIVWTPKENC